MTGRTHDLAAITLLTAVIVMTPLPAISLATAILAVLANQIGGILPDIDQPIAPFWRNLPIGGPIGRAFTKLLGGHRFLTHSLVGIVVIFFLAYDLLVFLQPIMPHVNIDLVWGAFVVGVVSHLIMDMFTKEGVPWLLPLPIKFGIPPIKHLRIVTGKKMEMFIVFPFLALVWVGICLSNYQQLLTLLHAHVVK